MLSEGELSHSPGGSSPWSPTDATKIRSGHLLLKKPGRGLDLDESIKDRRLDGLKTGGAEKDHGLPLGSRYLVSGSQDKNVRKRFFRAFGPRGRLGESVVELNWGKPDETGPVARSSAR